MELTVSYGISAMKLRYPFHNNSKFFFHNGDTYFSGLGRNAKLPTCSTPRMVSNGYVGRSNNSAKITYGTSNKLYERLDSCLIIPPPYGQKPRAVIKFLGGAFIGAVPEATYSYLLELLAAEGYLIISVPYNVTFDHAQAAREIYERFHACVDKILTSGLPIANLTASEFVQLPFYSVGHSNGALLQALVGSVFSEKIPKANAIISYNNRPAAEAVPYFEQLGPIIRQMMPVVEASPMFSMATNASGNAWNAVLDMVSMIPNYNQEAKESLTRFVYQLPSVMNQVTQGISEFKPTPAENCDCFRNSYNVKHTLLVKFNFDTIDETDLLEETLKTRVASFGGTLEKVVLTGTHITPCTQEPKWEVGNRYTPADAVSQALKTLSLNDIRALSRTITRWFCGLEE